MFCGSHWGGHYYISETQAGICSQVDVSKTASCWLDPGYVSQSGRKESVKSVAKTPASQAVSQLSYHLALTEEDHSRAEQITELCACFTVQETRDLPHEKTRQPGEPPCLEAVFRELQRGWRNLASGLYYRTALSHCTHSNGVRDVRPGRSLPRSSSNTRWGISEFARSAQSKGGEWRNLLWKPATSYHEGRKAQRQEPVKPPDLTRGMERGMQREERKDGKRGGTTV